MQYEFFELYSCILRGVLRDARENEHFRFEKLCHFYPIVKQWALETNKQFVEDIDEHMRVCREILSEPKIGLDHSIFNNRIIRIWVLTNACSEESPLALSLYERYLHELQTIDPVRAESLQQEHSRSIAAKQQK